MTLIAPPPAPGPEPDPSASGPDADLPTHGPDAAPPARLDREDAERLGLRIQHQAAVIAQATCEFLLMLAEFDAREGVRFYEGLKSTAHWLGWACSMAAGTAREHLRVARALPELPLTVAEFGAGRLSYSKVREITRVVGRVEEEVLVEMARAMTAAQLSRTISSFRAVDGSRLDQESRREARWHVREDGMVEIRAVLPAETGAELLTALELALDRDGTAPPSSTDPSACTPSPSHATARGAAAEHRDTTGAAATVHGPVGPGDHDAHDAIAGRCAEITAEATLEQPNSVGPTPSTTSPAPISPPSPTTAPARTATSWSCRSPPSRSSRTFPRERFRAAASSAAVPSSPALPNASPAPGRSRSPSPTSTGRSSTSDAPGASPPGPSAVPCGSATGPACSPAATRASTWTPTTSRPGQKGVRRISTSSRCCAGATT